jgi:hypothetical protein
MIKRVARPDLAGFEQQKGQIDSQLEDPLAENKVQSLDAYFSGEAAKSLGKYGIRAGDNATQSSALSAAMPQASTAASSAPATTSVVGVAAQIIPVPTSSVPSVSQPEITPPRVPGNFQASVGSSTASSPAAPPKETFTASGLKIVQKGAQLAEVVQPVTSQANTEILKPAAPLVQAAQTTATDATHTIPTATIPAAAIPAATIVTAAPENTPAVIGDDTEQKERLQDLMSAVSIDPAATAPTITLKPNQVAGVITDGASQPLAQVQVIVKDKPGNLLRAAYTDNKGKFLISSALPNGSYELEFIKIGYTFLPHQLELTGTQYPIYKYTAQT